MDEATVRKIIREELAFMIKNKKLVFPFPMQILDGNDITLAKNVGTRIGTATDQKIAFLGATPIAKMTGTLRDINSDPLPGAEGHDNYARAAISDINSVLTNFGFSSIS